MSRNRTPVLHDEHHRRLAADFAYPRCAETVLDSWRFLQRQRGLEIARVNFLVAKSYTHFL